MAKVIIRYVFNSSKLKKRVALSLTSTNITTTFHAHVTKYNYNDKKIMMEMIATENDETYRHECQFLFSLGWMISSRMSLDIIEMLV